MGRAYLLRLKIHPQQQVLEARVVAEGVDSQDLLRDTTKCLQSSFAQGSKPHKEKVSRSAFYLKLLLRKF